MRPSGFPALSSVICVVLSMPLAARAQPAGGVEARLRQLEAAVLDQGARLRALEGRAPGPAAPAAAAGVACTSVSVLAVWATPQSPLTVTVNGAAVGSYDDSISVTLDGFLRPGANTVGFSYPGEARPSTEAALKCRAPGADSSTTILTLKPTAGRLQAQASVDFTGRR